MKQSKKKFLPVLQGVKLSKTQSPTTAEDRKRMKVIPYASAIGSIKYANLGVDHWTSVKIILGGIRICFLIMQVTKGSS